MPINHSTSANHCYEPLPVTVYTISNRFYQFVRGLHEFLGWWIVTRANPVHVQITEREYVTLPLAARGREVPSQCAYTRHAPHVYVM